MPSGSHRTSGGSHSSGGSRSSSSSSSSSSRGFSSGGHHRRYGGGVYINGRLASPIASIIFLTIFIVFFCGGWLAGGILIGVQRNNELKQIEIDYIYYQDMITNAEAMESQGNNGFIIEGTVTGKFQSEYDNKWYLTYSFGGVSGLAYDGETYAIYDYEDVKHIIPNVTKIDLAADSNVINSLTDTVNIDYKNTTLEDDGYYNYTKKSMMFPQIICYVVTIGSFILIVSFIAKEIKRIKNKNNDTPMTVAENTSNTDYGSNHINYCNYCGAEIPANKHKCPNCGAKQ